jgi:hypothetical protein
MTCCHRILIEKKVKKVAKMEKKKNKLSNSWSIHQTLQNWVQNEIATIFL